MMKRFLSLPIIMVSIFSSACFFTSCNHAPSVSVVVFSSGSESEDSNTADFSQEASTSEDFTTESSIIETSSETSDLSAFTSSEITTEEFSSSVEEISTTASMEETASSSTQEMTTEPTTMVPTTSKPEPSSTVPTTSKPEPSSTKPTTTEAFVDSTSEVQTSEEYVDSSSEVETPDLTETSVKESSSQLDATTDSSTQTSAQESSSVSTTESVEETTTTASSAEEVALVTHSVKVVNAGKTFTGRSPLTQLTYKVTDPLNLRKLSTARHSFSFGAASNGKPHQITINNQRTFDSYNYNALAWDNKTSKKVLYLTFDCGYVYGDLVSQILDTLKAKNVPAAFFCTLDYLEDAPKDVTRMIQEGHIIGNHSSTHPTYSSSLTRTDIAWELLGVHNYLRVNFGYNCQFFRFPEGAYSPNALELVDSLGYHSVFWSIAHTDWDPDNQPGVNVSFNTVTSRLHPGAVILLHSTSPDNAAILGDLIDYARSQGYEFRSLDQYAHWTE